MESAGLDAGKLHVASSLPADDGIEGCILSNELLDALPFRRVRKRGGALHELLVGLDGDRFVDIEAEPSSGVRAYFDALGLEPGEGCEAEAGLAARDWTVRAASALKRGYLLSLDYGYEAHELYAPWRRRGTLLTFYRHTSGDDPYARVGRQDITASVDFTTLQRAGEQAGLTTLGLTKQADMLSALGALEFLGTPPPEQLEAYYALRRGVIELSDAAGLGRIRALFQGRGVPATLPAGLQTDRPSSSSD
jgi:SAM-dependent MidA family methyltransferase